MTATSPIRVDNDLYDSAKTVGAVMSRSAAQQLAHWARIGRELESGGSVPAPAIGDVLAGRADYDELDAYGQAAIRAEWVERISRRLADVDLVADFEAEGRSYAVLDDQGHVVVHNPTAA